MHTMIEMDNFDKAVLVSGDGDFHCLVEYLESRDKLKGLLVPNRQYSILFKKYSKYILRIETLKKALERKNAKINGRSKP